MISKKTAASKMENQPLMGTMMTPVQNSLTGAMEMEPIIQKEGSPPNIKHNIGAAANLKELLKAMKERIDILVPARTSSSMSLISEAGFEPRLLKRDYTRAEQELMIQTLGELEDSMFNAISQYLE